LIYGFVATWTKTPGDVNKSRWAMGALLYSTIPTISCLLWGINRKLSDKKKEDARNGTVT